MNPADFNLLLDQTLREHYSVEAPANLERQISAALRHRDRDRPGWTHHLPAFAFTAAAACCIALIIILPPPRSLRQPAVPSQPTRVETHASHVASIATARVAPPPKDVPRITTARSRSAATQLPTLPVFPSATTISPLEQQLLALSRHFSSPPLLTTTIDDPITIAAIEIKPIQIPLIATQPVP